MKSKSIRKNYIYHMVYQVVLILTPLVITPYLSRILGADGIGTASFVFSVASYFVLAATLGTPTYGQREVSFREADREQRSRVFWEVKLFQCGTTLLSLAAFLVFASLQKEPLLYLIAGIQILSVITDVSWFFQGIEEFRIVTIRNVIVRMVYIAFIFCFVRTKEDLAWYMLGLVGFECLGNVTLWLRLPAYVQRIRLKDLRIRGHIGNILKMFIPFVAIQIYTVMDKTMIGLLTGDPVQNGYYEQAVKIPYLLMALVTAYGAVIKPRIGQYYAQGNETGIRELLDRSFRCNYMISIPLALGIVAVAELFVPLFFGEEFIPIVLHVRILALLLPVIGMSNITGLQYMVTTKREKRMTVSVCIGAVLNFALNLVLIPGYGALGAAIASLAAESCITIVQLVMMRQYMKIGGFLGSSLKYLLAGGIMLAVVYAVSRQLTVSIRSVILLGSFGTAVYVIGLLVLKDSFFFGILKGIADKMKVGKHNV